MTYLITAWSSLVWSLLLYTWRERERLAWYLWPHNSQTCLVLWWNPRLYQNVTQKGSWWPVLAQRTVTISEYQWEWKARKNGESASLVQEWWGPPETEQHGGEGTGVMGNRDAEWWSWANSEKQCLLPSPFVLYLYKWHLPHLSPRFLEIHGNRLRNQRQPWAAALTSG